MSEINWKIPCTLSKNRNDLPDFPLEALPDIPRETVRNVSASTSTDPAMAATMTLASLSYCFAGLYQMEGKLGHTEPINLYTLIFADPAERKSPVLRSIRKPYDTFKTYPKRLIQYDNQEETNVDTEESAPENEETPETPANALIRICVDDISPEGLVTLLDDAYVVR